MENFRGLFSLVSNPINPYFVSPGLMIKLPTNELFYWF